MLDLVDQILEVPPQQGGGGIPSNAIITEGGAAVITEGGQTIITET